MERKPKDQQKKLHCIEDLVMHDWNRQNMFYTSFNFFRVDSRIWANSRGTLMYQTKFPPCSWENHFPPYLLNLPYDIAPESWGEVTVRMPYQNILHQLCYHFNRIWLEFSTL